MGFGDFIFWMEDVGIADVLLPFILIFTVVFAILQKTRILSGGKTITTHHRNMNAMISMVMGFAVVIPHITGSYPYGADVVEILNAAVPKVSLVIIIVLMIMVLLGLFGWEFAEPGEENTWAGILGIIGVLVVVFIFVSSSGWGNTYLPYWLQNVLDSETKNIIIMLIVFGLVIFFITKPEKETEKRGRGFASLFKKLDFEGTK
ncbi:hypothetical protein JW868_01385 [Candidatus Woesearchaeota archaeon]|nr:hypothetical protein [Candidatus Woesearchaeota archaeon]